MRRTVRVDVFDGCVQRVHYSNRELWRAILTVPIANRLHIAIQRADPLIAVNADVAVLESIEQFWNELVCDVAVHEHGLDRIARCRIVELRVFNDTQREFVIRRAIDVDVTDPFRVAEHWDTRVGLHVLHK